MTRRAGTPCPRCGGSVVRLYRDEPASCLSCGHVPPGQREPRREGYSKDTEALMQQEGYSVRGKRI